MRTTCGAILAAVAITLAGAAAAQGRAPAVSGTERTAPMLPNRAPPEVSKSPPVLFWIGNLPVRLWAPVEPSYDANANRAAAVTMVWAAP